MVQIAGKYEKIGSVGVAEYLKARGVPEDRIKEDENDKSLDIIVSGDKIQINGRIKQQIEIGQVTESTLPKGEKIKHKASLNGNTLSIESTGPDGKPHFRDYVFSDTGLEIVLKSQDGKQAKRTYKRL